MKFGEGFFVLYCADIERTKVFWEGVGGNIVESDEGKVVVKVGNHELHYVLESEEPFEEYQFATKGMGRGRGVLFYVEVEEVEVLRRLILEVSDNRVSEIRENHWGAVEFLFEDPDGYCVVAYQMR